MEWTRREAIRFMRFYKNHPCIWNPNHAAYRNKRRVDQAWANIKRKMGPQYSIKELKKKKQCLMAVYRSFRRVDMKKSGSNDDFQRPSWYAYDVIHGFMGPVFRSKNKMKLFRKKQTDNSPSEAEPTLHTSETERSLEAEHSLETEHSLKTERTPEAERSLDTERSLETKHTPEAGSSLETEPQYLEVEFNEPDYKEEIDFITEELDVSDLELESSFSVHEPSPQQESTTIHRQYSRPDIHRKNKDKTVEYTTARSKTNDKDECYHFGKLIEKKLLRIPEDRRDLMMIKITKLLYEEYLEHDRLT